MVRSDTVLLGVAIDNHLWEQDVGGSNPLAPTKYSVKTPFPGTTPNFFNNNPHVSRSVGLYSLNTPGVVIVCPLQLHFVY